MMPALAMAAQHSGLGPQTALTAETRDQGGRTQTTVRVTVTARMGCRSGAVAISDHGRQLAGAALNAEGQAKVMLDLPAGDHLLRAVYTGNTTHQASASLLRGSCHERPRQPRLSGFPPLRQHFSHGRPVRDRDGLRYARKCRLIAARCLLRSPARASDQSSCTFTPENIEILPEPLPALTSSMVLVTQMASQPRSHIPVATPCLGAAASRRIPAWAAYALGTRRRRWLSSLWLAALVGLVTLLGQRRATPLQLRHPRPAPESRHPGGHLHDQRHRAVQQRHHRDHTFHHDCSDRAVAAVWQAA